MRPLEDDLIPKQGRVTGGSIGIWCHWHNRNNKQRNKEKLKNMQAKKKTTVKVRDLKPSKGAKGGRGAKLHRQRPTKAGPGILGGGKILK